MFPVFLYRLLEALQHQLAEELVVLLTFGHPDHQLPSREQVLIATVLHQRQAPPLNQLGPNASGQLRFSSCKVPIIASARKQIGTPIVGIILTAPAS